MARQAKIAAELAAKKRAATQRRAVIFGLGFVVLAAIVLIVNRDDGDDTTVATDTPTTLEGAPATSPEQTLPTATESAAGKPCVARSQPLPAGAPEVDVEVGPPPTALVKKDLSVGSGAPVPEGANLKVNYIGVACSSGVIFDSSYKTGAPATLPLTGVIPGWQQGIPGMNVGGKRLLGIPPALAYGDQASPNGTFAAQETLWFVIEVVEVIPS